MAFRDAVQCHISRPVVTEDEEIQLTATRNQDSLERARGLAAAP